MLNFEKYKNKLVTFNKASATLNKVSMPCKGIEQTIQYINEDKTHENS